ncbi:MAG: hypothetical protein KDB90_12715 [Planctomycetes bacterium]|nr:hypothetical protein [Planctomycetota bacterium]
MGIESEFFAATDAELQFVLASPDGSSDDLQSIEFKRLTDVEMATLEEALTGADSMRLIESGPPPVYDGREDGPWISRLSKSLIAALASIDDSQAAAAAVKWVETEELADWAQEDGREVIDAMRQLAHHAAASGRSVYLRVSL